MSGDLFLDGNTGYHQVGCIFSHHVVILRHLDRAFFTEIRAGSAECAGSKIKTPCDILSAFHFHRRTGNGVGRTDFNAHAAVHTGFGIERDPSSVFSKTFRSGIRKDLRAGRSEKIRQGCFQIREHHLCIASLFFFRIRAAVYSPSMMASGLGVQPATATSTCTKFSTGASTE